MKKIYAITYCQNGYQKERIRNFLKSQKVIAINKDLERIADFKEIKKSDEVWVIVNAAFYKRIAYEDRRVLFSGLKPKYFHTVHLGKYCGKVREATRNELRESYFPLSGFPRR